MVLLRSVAKKDFPTVLSLARLLNSYNLPHDRRFIRKLIQSSIRSFQGKLPKTKAKYLFVIETLPSKKVFGASLIVAQQGTPASPHIYYEKEGSLLRFGATKNGPTEIGGLILQHPFRRRKEKFGKQLSWVRFLYMTSHPERFGKQVLAEFLPPLPKGKSFFWDAVGKRFTGLSYRQADRLSIDTKEFVFDLFPKKLRIASLPEKVRSLLGKVAPQAEGACRMLEEIGFRQIQRIEPFDGGPYYAAGRGNIAVIQGTKRGRFEGENGRRVSALMLVERQGKIRACVGGYHRLGERLFLDETTQHLLGVRKGEKILYVPWR